MPEFTIDCEKLIRESHDSIKRLEDALLGINGQGGMMRRVQELENNYSKLNRNFWILVSLLIGSGVLSVSALGLLGKL
jgi:Mg2+ and Co2+ transporter CorA